MTEIKQRENMWVCVVNGRIPILFTIADCMEESISKMGDNWENLEKHGARCLNVNISFEVIGEK